MKNDRKVIENKRRQLDNNRDVFLFNTRLEMTQQDQAIQSLEKQMQDDDEIADLGWIDKGISYFKKYPDMVILGGLNGLEFIIDDKEKWGYVNLYKDDLLEDLEDKIEDTTGFHVLDHELKFYGQCKECQKRGRKIVR